MKIEDMILVSIDDHVIEPPDLFEKHLPAKYRDRGPKFERLDNGVDQWVFQGEVMGTVGLGATASWPKEEWGFDPVGLAEMRPGCYDIHERVRDMNANGVLASVNFPTAAGFAGAWLAGKPDRELSAAAVSAYNDWQIDDLAGSYPGRIIPMGLLPLWDTDACVRELERIAAKGCTTVSFPETPYSNGLPGFYGDHWDPVLAAAERLQIVLSMHIGGAFNLLQRPEGADMDSASPVSLVGASYRYLVAVEPPVGRHEVGIAAPRLGDEHAVERVTMVEGQRGCGHGVLAVDVDVRHAALLEFTPHLVGGGEPSEPSLDLCFPNARDADEHVVALVGDRVRDAVAKAFAAAHHPERGVRVKQDRRHRGRHARRGRSARRRCDRSRRTSTPCP